MESSIARLDHDGQRPARHEPAADRGGAPDRRATCPSVRSYAARLAGLEGAGRVRGRRLPRRTSTPGCSSGSWPTWSPTPCATATGRRGHRRPAGRGSGSRVVDHGPASTQAAEPDLRAVPAARATLRHRRRSRPGGGPRPDRGAGRDASRPTDTPGGGLTMVLDLPPGRAREGPARRRRRDPAPDAGDRAARRGTRGAARRGRSVALCRPLREDKPDVVVLDLGLPDLSGVEVLRRLRGWSTMPVVVLSARAESTEKVQALDLGADDYVTKPFGMEELLARVRAVGATCGLRRPGARGGRPGDRPAGAAGHQVAARWSG